MIERGSGPTTDLGGTNWALLDVPTIWATLADHETGNHWRLVVGWRRTCELTMAHLGRLTEYRDRLVQAWPPERSAAAREYVSRLDHLIGSLRQTHDVAADNYDTFSAATTAIGATRTKVQSIHDQYVAKRQEKQEYEENLARLKSAGMPNPRGLRPPVADDELEQLNIQARQLMTGLSGELRQAQAQLRHPPRYEPGARIDEPQNELSPPPTPPQLPLISPTPLALTAGPAGAKSEPSAQVSLASHGPILGSINTQAGGSPGSSGSGNPPSIITAPRDASLPNHAAPISGNTRPAIEPPLHSSRKTGPTTGQTTSTPTDTRRLPHSGIIGSAPSPAHGPSTSATTNRQAHPTGGIISGGAGAIPVGNASHQPGASVNQTSTTPNRTILPADSRARTNEQHRDSDHRRCTEWNPDHPWELVEGVEPVICRQREVDQTNPGPAIGIDR